MHGSLYRAAEVAITSTYLHDIMVDLQEILEMKLEEDITPVQLSVDMAVPLALFMTEAVTNAMNHMSEKGAAPSEIPSTGLCCG